MKLIILSTILILSVVSVLSDDKYTTKYDNINVDEILGNKRLLHKYADCVMNKETKCPPDAVEVKSHIREALQTGCTKCSETQKNVVKKVCSFMRKNEPQLWTDITGYYDPTGEFQEKFGDQCPES